MKYEFNRYTSAKRCFVPSITKGHKCVKEQQAVYWVMGKSTSVSELIGM